MSIDLTPARTGDLSALATSLLPEADAEEAAEDLGAWETDIRCADCHREVTATLLELAQDGPCPLCRRCPECRWKCARGLVNHWPVDD